MHLKCCGPYSRQLRTVGVEDRTDCDVGTRCNEQSLTDCDGEETWDEVGQSKSSRITRAHSQMQQSVTLAAAADGAFKVGVAVIAVAVVAPDSIGAPPPNALSCAKAAVLTPPHQACSLKTATRDSLETVHPSLPPSIQLDFDLDTPVDLLRPSLIVHSQL